MTEIRLHYLSRSLINGDSGMLDEIRETSQQNIRAQDKSHRTAHSNLAGQPQAALIRVEGTLMGA